MEPTGPTGDLPFMIGVIHRVLLRITAESSMCNLGFRMGSGAIRPAIATVDCSPIATARAGGTACPTTLRPAACLRSGPGASGSTSRAPGDELTPISGSPPRQPGRPARSPG
jgi:hypothetical protein